MSHIYFNSHITTESQGSRWKRDLQTGTSSLIARSHVGIPEVRGQDVTYKLLKTSADSHIYSACRFTWRLLKPVIRDAQVCAKEKDLAAQAGPGKESNHGCH